MAEVLNPLPVQEPHLSVTEPPPEAVTTMLPGKVNPGSFTIANHVPLPLQVCEPVVQEWYEVPQPGAGQPQARGACHGPVMERPPWETV